MQEPPPKKTSQIPAFRRRVAEQMADHRRRLAERVEYERKLKSFSQETLALSAGVSPKTVKRIEEEKTDNPRAVTIRRLATALKVDPDKLRPPAELEADQLDRIEKKLDHIIELIEEEKTEAAEASLGQDEHQALKQGNNRPQQALPPTSRSNQ